MPPHVHSYKSVLSPLPFTKLKEIQVVRPDSALQKIALRGPEARWTKIMESMWCTPVLKSRRGPHLLFPVQLQAEISSIIPQSK